MKYLCIAMVMALSLVGCERPVKVNLPAGGDIPGLAAPVRLGLGSSSIMLTDYFPDVSVIDSVFIGEKKINLPENKVRIFYRAPRDLQPVTVMTVWAGQANYCIPVFGSRKERVDLEFDPGQAGYGQVEVAGEFNGWVPSRAAMSFTNGKWATSFYLEPGVYQYRLVVDGKWITDPGNPDSVSNNAGGFNSMLTVAAAGDVPRLITGEFERGEIELLADRPVDSLLVLWQNHRVPVNYISRDEEGEIEIPIPVNAGTPETSFIRAWAWNEGGASAEVLVPLKNGKVIDDPSILGRTDMHGAVIYNVFVDRFFNGDKGNDDPVDDPEILPPANYHGGDIAGVTQKLGYLAELGVNTVWISPIVENPDSAYGLWPEPRTKFSGYHGYWPVSFTRIDPRFGTAAELHDLVDRVHSGEMNILLDFVANHVHRNHPVYQENPGWATELYLPDGSLNTERWDEYRLTTWFDVFLPTLNLEKPEVTEMLSDSAIWWLETYGLDGFRHDATKHIPEIFWRTLTLKIKDSIVIPEERKIYQIGETYGSAELIGSYVNSGMLDGQFDFNVYDAAVGVFGRDEDGFSRLESKLRESFDFYGNHNLMGYITGNQDRARFISYAGGDLRWEEDAKRAGWTREIGVGDTIGYDRLAMLMAFNMTIPGIPVIYYGDEFGMPGGNDPDNRRMMRFGDDLTDREKQMLAKTKELVSLRRDHLSLLYGDFITLLVEDKQFVYARKYFDETAVIFFNKSNEKKEMNVKMCEVIYGDIDEAYFTSQYIKEEGMLKTTVAPWSFAVVFLRK